MSTYDLLVPALAVVLGAGLGFLLAHRRRARAQPERVRRILLPFTGLSISRRAVDAALRLARAENATIMPCYLATVPLTLPLDAALPRQCLRAMPLLDVLEQQAALQDVPVDSRVWRGRTARDALRRALQEERVDRVIISAEDGPTQPGLNGEDLLWLLDRAEAEVLILRPDRADERVVHA